MASRPPTLVAAQSLYVYRKALDSVESVEVVACAIEARRPDHADQMRRAASSVVLNLSEGANEFSLRDKLRFYRMARRSGAEVDAALEMVARLRLCDDVETARRANARVMGLITRTMAGLDARRADGPSSP